MMTLRFKRAMHRKAGKSITLLYLVVGLTVVWPVGSLGASARSFDSGFCCGHLAHDYLKRLQGMVPVRHLPPSGRLPFAPKRLSLQILGEGLRVGAGKIGFVFTDSAVNQKRRLGWRIDSRLIRVDGRGHELLSLAERSQKLGNVKIEEQQGLAFAVKGIPAYYRVDIVFRNNAGQLLGNYSEYFRVVRPRFAVQLAIDGQSFHAGQAIYARLENFGTEPVLPSKLYKFERYEGADWTVDSSISPGVGVKPAIRSVLLGGISGKCLKLDVPADQPPGIYRLSNSVSRSRQPGVQVLVSGGFQITS